VIWLALSIPAVALFAAGFIWWKIFRAVIPHHNGGEYDGSPDARY